MSEKAKASPAVFTLKVVIGLVIIFGFQYIPAPAPMTQLGMNLIGIFLGTIWLYTFGGMLWPSFLALLALGYTGATGTLSQTVQAAMGNSIMWQLVMLFPLCEAISRTGAAREVAGWMMSRKFIKGRPMAIMVMLFLVGYVLGVLIGATATMLIMFSLTNSIRDMMGYKRGDAWAAGTTMGVFITAFIGGAAIPYRGFIAAMVAPFESIMGYPLDAGVFVVVDIIVGIVISIVIPLFMKWFHKADFSKVAEFDYVKQFGAIKLDRQQLLLLLGLVVIMVFFIVQIIVPKETDLGAALNGFGANGIFTVVAILLAIITVGGKPVLDLRFMMKEGCPWGIVIGVGAMVTVAGQFSSDATGITAWLNMVMGNLLGGLPSVLVVFITLALTVIITGFFSNVGTCLIMLAAILPICVPMGVNPTGMAVGIVIASYLAVLSPGGSGACPVLFGNENMSYAKIYKNALPVLLVFVVLTTAIVMILSI